DDGAFSSFSAEYESMGSCAHYLFIGESRDPKTLYEEIKSFLSDLPAHFPEKEDFERIKRSLYADYIRSFDSTESIATEVITGAFRDVDYLSVGKWMSEITYEDFKEKYIRYFEDKEFSLTVIYPEN
ncbi:MAG: hypothetical protein MJ078_01135, partial [Clostridia bacterium]|nr:hypothetical protein [Clostridia bacterium]